ncbi:P22 phage major capsid protein family protein [Sphingomonas sp. SRS2]|uniref:P22 phage major capsid protein family protein n=1 Tax=Sphingomonas sp. SRS2 TaxID=133190 RepID=UPI00061844B6|nr:P22 phage major capsid protein family protein [Sphingomonas sp. SRS2]KKC25826.1 hypothetical protein WP12_12290 [Sphingomonas sp. SRS2]
MANGFSREEKVMFDAMLEGFEDALVYSKMAKVTLTNQEQMERTGDIMWFPQPYIMTSYDGNDATSNFKDVVQLSVPATINNQRHSPWKMTAKELRDPQQRDRIQTAAKDELASRINISAMNAAALYGSVWVKRAVAATGYDDISLADASFTEQGIPRSDRVIAIPPRTYNLMAGTLAKPQTSGLDRTLSAYDRAFLGDTAGFNTFKADYGYRLPARLGVGVTIENTLPLYYTPTAYTTTAGIGSLNTDNRFQTIAITVTSGTVAVGDVFTLPSVNAVHHIAKTNTGQLKTFRIVEIVTGAGGTGTVKITPPIISGTGGTGPELQYQNVTAAPADGDALTFLNTVAAEVTPFWQGDALQILPGRLAPQENAGMAVVSATTKDGFQLTMTRQGEINDLTCKYRVDALWGVLAANTEMMGGMQFSQS